MCTLFELLIYEYIYINEVVEKSKLELVQYSSEQ
jgi:hypothetical protein